MQCDYLIVEVIRMNVKNEENRRKTISVSLSPEIRKALKELQESLTYENGSKYPMSYVVEDIISWVLSDEERYNHFIEDNYIVDELFAEGEEEDEEENKGS